MKKPTTLKEQITIEVKKRFPNKSESFQQKKIGQLTELFSGWLADEGSN